MFPREQRLTESRLFQSAFQRGTRSKGRTFTIFRLTTGQPGRVGFVITKKVSKSAVVRNRTKRRLRSALQVALHDTKRATLLQKGHLVVLIHRTSDETAFADLVTEMTTALNRYTEAA